MVESGLINFQKTGSDRTCGVLPKKKLKIMLDFFLVLFTLRRLDSEALRLLQRWGIAGQALAISRTASGISSVMSY
jgi:hypothetical protein